MFASLTSSSAGISDDSNEISVGGHEAAGHARGVERKAGIAVTVEENQSAVAVRAFRKQMNRLARGDFGRRKFAGRARWRIYANAGLPQ